jgi:hypothetical protein
MSDGVLCLKATGNAFDDTVFYFTVGADNWLELADKPCNDERRKGSQRRLKTTCDSKVKRPAKT